MTRTRDELVGIIGDAMVRQLPPEWTRVAIQRRVNGASTDDLLLAALALLHEQQERIDSLEREHDDLVSDRDRLEDERDDLTDEVKTLRRRLHDLKRSAR
jgi:hypothetical protein